MGVMWENVFSSSSRPAADTTTTAAATAPIREAL